MQKIREGSAIIGKFVFDFVIAITEFILLIAIITTAVFYGGFVINFLLS